MINTSKTPALSLSLALLLAAPGCATLNKLFNGEDEGQTEAQADTGEPSPEQLAAIDEKIETQLGFLAERPVEPWDYGRAHGTLLGITQDINIVSHNYASEEAKQQFRQQRFGKLQGGWNDYFSRAHQSAMASGDPELAQALTSLQLTLQEDFTWYAERADVMARLREQAEAIASFRQGVFEDRGEHTKLNEAACVAAPKPLAAFGKAQPELTWHFTKPSEVHVRCLFPTTLDSQTSGGMSFEIVGEVNVWGSTGEGEDDRLVQRTIEVPVEVGDYRDKRYFDFAFDLGDAAKGTQWGYVRLNGIVEWTVVDEQSGLDTRRSYASMRISYE